jgi:ribosomal protein S1
MLEESIKTIHTGEIVKGTVIGVKEDQIILNIGYKSDGIITRQEYTNNNSLDLRTVVQVGEELEAKVMKVNDGDGQVAMSYRRMAADRGNKRLEEAFNNHEVLTAKVVQVLNGGLSVMVEEARVFIPASLVSDSYERDLTKYQDQEISFVMKDYDPKKRRYIGDRKQILVKEKAEAQTELLGKIQVGDIIDGVIKNVTDFGAFVDLGGIDGLLHISEMSWGRIDNPKKHFKVGDSIKVKIKEINGTKVALTAKFDDANPWKDAASKYAVGNVVTGRVARMTDFGAFVELEPGVDALLHVSQISKDHIAKPSDVLKKDEEVTAKIVDFNEETQKISLSVKALLPDDAADDAEEAPAEETAETADAPAEE